MNVCENVLIEKSAEQGIFEYVRVRKALICRLADRQSWHWQWVYAKNLLIGKSAEQEIQKCKLYV